jgi:cytochrome c556
MPRFLSTLSSVGLVTLVASVALAQEQDTPESVAVEVRQGHMLNYASNLGVIGPMAQGNAAYDAAAAQAAADNIFHLASIHQDRYWLPGTSSEEFEGSHALPAIWENPEDFASKQAALLEAATALQAAAGTDLAGLQGALGGVGQACGSCHQAYRAPMN